MSGLLLRAKRQTFHTSDAYSVREEYTPTNVTVQGMVALAIRKPGIFLHLFG